MAVAFIDLPKSLKNGPEEIGIAAGVDLLTDPGVALVLCQVNPGLVAFANAHIPPSLLGESNKVLVAYARLSYFFVAQHRWDAHDQTCNVVAYQAGVHIAPTEETVKDVAAALQLAGGLWSNVATLLVATKVTWWSQNHHVGQTEYSGYAKKVAMLFLGDNFAAFKSVHWALGHTMSTRAILHKLGVAGVSLTGLVEIPGFPGVTRDIAIRLGAAPAGCAKLYDVYTILCKASATVYSVFWSPVSDFHAIVASYEATKANPSSYHIGAQYLTGTQRKEPYVPAEDTQEMCSAHIHATQPSGTLAKNRTLPPKAQVVASQVYQSIVSFRTSMASTKPDPATMRSLMPRVGGNMLADFATAAEVAPYRYQLLLPAPESASPVPAAAAPSASASLPAAGSSAGPAL